MEDNIMKDLEVIDDPKTKAVLLKILKEKDSNTEKIVDQKVKEKLDAAGVTDEDLALSDRRAMLDRKKVNSVAQLWKNNGFIDGAQDQVSFADLAKMDLQYQKKMRDNFSTDHPLLIPRVIANIAREAIPPAMVLTPLLQRVNYQTGAQIVFPSWGGVGPAADLAEGQEYPERSMELSGSVTATIGKSGLAVKITEEMVRYSQYDVMAMHFRAAGRSLAMWKERKAANLILDNGRTILDNAGGTTRTTTGRDAAGAYNGTLTLDDIFYVYGDMVNNGFTPNCIIMHPFAWKIFAQEGISRAFGFINGVANGMWQLPQGSPAQARQWSVGSNGLNNVSTVTNPEHLATTFSNVPSIFPTSFRIIVTPYMTFDSTTSRTTIAFADVNELGILIVDEEVQTEQWNDPSKDIMKVKFRERYAMAATNNGYGIGLLKDISLDRSYDFHDRVTLPITGGLTDALTKDTGNYTNI